MDCVWLEPNHTYFQLANTCLALTYFVPDTIKGLILLRLLLCGAGMFFSLWGVLILCSPDTFGWNLAFAIVNFFHVVYLWYTTMRPIKFNEQHETVFSVLFEPFKVARWQYKSISMIGTKRVIPKGEVICTELHTICEDLSLVTNGSVRVMKHGRLLHRTRAYEFLNAPEWIASSSANGNLPIAYEVTLISDGCTLVVWPRTILRNTLKANVFLRNIFDSLIGQDVTKKLYKIHNKIATAISIDTISNGVNNIAFERDQELVEADEGKIRSYSHCVYEPEADDSPKEIRIIKKVTNSMKDVQLEIVSENPL